MTKNLIGAEYEIAHPILAAEVELICNVPFEIWDLKRLLAEVKAAA